MKLLLIGSLLIISGFSYATAAAQSSQTQQSIYNNSGVALQAGGNISNVDITVIQGSTDYKKYQQAYDKAKKYLDKNPSDPDFVRDFQIAKKELDDFTSHILKLAEDIEKIPLNSERGIKAKHLFEKGDYQAAREVLDAKEMDQEQRALLEKQQKLEEEQEEIAAHLKNLAGEFILKAKLTAVEYSLGEERIAETRKYFEQALKSGRDPEYLFTYAFFLAENNQFTDAEKLYRETLQAYRELAKVNSQMYRFYVAITLNNLGNLISADSSRHKEAEEFYQNALQKYRELAKEKPQAYRPDVAMTLNNLGILVAEDSSRHKEAEMFLRESLKNYRELAKTNPQLFQSAVAQTLNNLGILIAKDSSRRKEVEVFYREALETFRELAKANSQAYQPYVGLTLNNLGLLIAENSNRHKEAEAFYQEALTIHRGLAKANPQVYRSYLAGTLNNLGLLIAEDSNRHKEAESPLQESLTIIRELAKANPQVYRPDVANVLDSLGDTYLKWQQPEQAIPYLQEAHRLFIELAKDAPGVFGGEVERVEKLLKQARGDN